MYWEGRKIEIEIEMELKLEISMRMKFSMNIGGSLIDIELYRFIKLFNAREPN